MDVGSIRFGPIAKHPTVPLHSRRRSPPAFPHRPHSHPRFKAALNEKGAAWYVTKWTLGDIVEEDYGDKVKKQKNPRKHQVFVEVPEPKSFLDTATMPMILTVVGCALVAKLLMMYDDSKSQETIERKIKNAPAGQGTVRMLTREEWEEIREMRPRTPFESKLARPDARIRTGEPVQLEDLRDWTIDVITDGLARAEETVHSTN